MSERAEREPPANLGAALDRIDTLESAIAEAIALIERPAFPKWAHAVEVLRAAQEARP